MNAEDVQTVADECLNRPLSDDEIEMIEDAIAERVDWFGAIEGAILDKIGQVKSMHTNDRTLKITTRPEKAA